MKPAKVLVVDDDEDFAEFAATILEASGHKAVAVLRAEEGFPAALAEKPDLILLDLMMPGLDGTAVIKQLKGDPATRGIPVLLCSIVKNSQHIAPALAAGAADFLPKPFTSGELKSFLERLLPR